MTDKMHMQLHRKEFAFALLISAFALTTAFALNRLSANARRLDRQLAWVDGRVDVLETGRVPPTMPDDTRIDPFTVKKA